MTPIWSIAIAIYLLLTRFFALKYLAKIFKRQIVLLNHLIDVELFRFRIKLHYIVITLIVSNFIPIALDLSIIVGYLGWSDIGKSPILWVSYLVNNVLFVYLFAYLLYSIYKLADDSQIEVEVLERRQIETKKRR